MVLSRNMWAQAQQSHGLYNPETIDTIGMSRLKLFILCFSNVFTPLVVFTDLVIVAYGNDRWGAGSRVYREANWFSWNTTVAARQPVLRFGAFVATLAVACTISVFFWVNTVGSLSSAVLVVLNVFFVLLYWSSSDKIHQRLKPLYSRLSTMDAALLIYLVTSAKVPRVATAAAGAFLTLRETAADRFSF